MKIKQSTLSWNEKMTDRQRELLFAMKNYGGSFASTLAEAWLYADADNQVKLEQAFGDLLEKYDQFLRR